MVVTGAGVSVASGLPTFRGTEPDAIWSTSVTERGTLRFFREDPVESWRWYLARFDSLTSAQPNPAHDAIAQLEKGACHNGSDFLLVTQNIDGLHTDAGSEQLVEVHGRGDRMRCASMGCDNGAPKGSRLRTTELDAFRDDPKLDAIPRCELCGDLMRPHVLWFDERYDQHRDYAIERVLRASKEAGVVVFAGTSFAVGVTDMVLSNALRRGAALYNVDPSGRSPHPKVTTLSMNAEVAFPQLVAGLIQ